MGIIKNVRKGISSIFTSSDPFYRKDGSIEIGGYALTPLEYKYNNLWQLLEKNPIAYIFVNKRANYCSKAEFTVKDAKGNEYEKEPILETLNNPNFHQTRISLIKDFVFNASLYGYSFIRPVDAGVKNTRLIVLRGDNIKHIPITAKEYAEGIITGVNPGKFEYTAFGKRISYKYSDIITIVDTVQKDVAQSLAQADVMKPIIDNNRLRIEADNVLTNSPGGRGFIYPDSSDSAGDIPLSDKEKSEVEKRLHENYGTAKTKNQIGVSNKKLGMLEMRQNLRDFLLDEGKKRDVEFLLATYDMPRELFPFSSGATYENQKQMELKYLQGDPKQLMDNFAAALSHWFYPKGDKKLTVSFEHLPAFYEIRKERAEMLNKLSQAGERLVKMNIYTEAEIKELIENER